MDGIKTYVTTYFFSSTSPNNQFIFPSGFALQLQNSMQNVQKLGLFTVQNHIYSQIKTLINLISIRKTNFN